MARFPVVYRIINFLESNLLERNDFRFIEMVLHPTVSNLKDMVINEHRLSVSIVDDNEVSFIADIAEKVFGYERFHVDPWLDMSFGDIRYR